MTNVTEGPQEVTRKLKIENYEDQIKAYQAAGVSLDHGIQGITANLKEDLRYKQDILEALTVSERRALENERGLMVSENEKKTLTNEKTNLETEVKKLQKKANLFTGVILLMMIVLAGITFFFFTQTSNLKKQLQEINQPTAFYEFDNKENEYTINLQDTNKYML